MKNLWVRASILASVFAMAGCADTTTEEPVSEKCTQNVCKDASILTLCNNGETMDVTCTLGCENGQCKQPATNCQTDVCKDATTLLRCMNGSQIPVECPNGCSNNQCNAETNPTQPCTMNQCQNADILLACTGGVQNAVPCPYGCENGQCKQACTSDMCKDPSTLLACNNGKATEVPCKLGCNAGKCNAACTEDFCRDAQILMHCDNGETVAVDCPYGCNAGKCNSNPPQKICDEGVKQCDPDGNAQECQNNSWKTTTCQYGCTNGVCNATQACQNGQKQCDDNNNALVCENAVWQTTPCAKGCSNGVCLACTAEETQCASDGKTLQTCVNGAWKNSQACPVACSGGECVTNTSCTDKATQCNGNYAQTCQNEQWNTGTLCQFGCENGACKPAPAVCSGTEKKCNEAYVQTCKNGQWDIAATACPNGCENGVCKEAPAVCSGTEKECNGVYVQTCTNGQWVKASTPCENGCQNGACKTSTELPKVGDICTEDTTSVCDNNTLYHCDTNNKIAATACGSDFCAVDAEDPTFGTCTTKCAASDKGNIDNYYCLDYGVTYAIPFVCKLTANNDYAFLPDFIGASQCKDTCNATDGCSDSMYYACGDEYYDQNRTITLAEICKEQSNTAIAVCSGSYYECAEPCTTIGQTGTACTEFDDGTFQYPTICTQVGSNKVMLDSSATVADYTECTSGTCNATHSACETSSASCQNGKKQCYGAYVQTCTGGKWVNATSACPNGCENGACKSSGSTHPTVGSSCTEDTPSVCDNNTLYYCSDNKINAQACGNTSCKIDAFDSTIGTCTTECNASQAGENDGYSCLTIDDMTYAIPYKCEITADGTYGYMPDLYDYKICTDSCSSTTGCSSAPTGSSTHKLGAKCTSAQKGNSGCDGNTLVLCDGSSFVNALGSYTCSDFGNGYYCDEQVDYDFADCVKTCTKENTLVNFSTSCNTSYNDFEIFFCEMGDSGNLGTFGGYYAESLCYDSTTQILCDGEEIVTKTCSSCTNVSPTGDEDYSSVCK